MSIGLPNAAGSRVPSVPPPGQLANPHTMHEYLQRLTRELERVSNALFDNDKIIVGAINSGTSGTFTISSGGSIIVTSGLVITVTS